MFVCALRVCEFEHACVNVRDSVFICGHTACFLRTFKFDSFQLSKKKVVVPIVVSIGALLAIILLEFVRQKRRNRVLTQESTYKYLQWLDAKKV